MFIVSTTKHKLECVETASFAFLKMVLLLLYWTSWSIWILFW